jgi:hypothetical protein
VDQLLYRDAFKAPATLPNKREHLPHGRTLCIARSNRRRFLSLLKDLQGFANDFLNRTKVAGLHLVSDDLLLLRRQIDIHGLEIPLFDCPIIPSRAHASIEFVSGTTRRTARFTVSETRYTSGFDADDKMDVKRCYPFKLSGPVIAIH